MMTDAMEQNQQSAPVLLAQIPRRTRPGIDGDIAATSLFERPSHSPVPEQCASGMADAHLGWRLGSKGEGDFWGLSFLARF